MTCGHPERPIPVLSCRGFHKFTGETKSHRACYHYFTYYKFYFYLAQMTFIGLFYEIGGTAKAFSIPYEVQ